MHPKQFLLGLVGMTLGMLAGISPLRIGARADRAIEQTKVTSNTKQFIQSFMPSEFK